MRFRVFLLIAVVLLAGCRREVQRTPEVVAVPAAKLPTDPGDAVWEQAPEHLAKLMLQDQVEPRLMSPSTAEVKVRAVTDGSRLAFRLEWADEHKNDTPGPAKFIDACAIQLPEKQERDAPDPQMGGSGKVVEVTYWRADWQAAVDGRGDSIRDLYPNASIDHYPFQAQSLPKGSAAQKEMELRYSPARALGNLRGASRSTPVEELVANGPGSLKPGPSREAGGKGLHGKDGWRVVISRKAPAGLAPRQRTQIAFAVWQGSRGETGARKMRTGWVPLLMRGE